VMLAASTRMTPPMMVPMMRSLHLGADKGKSTGSDFNWE